MYKERKNTLINLNNTQNFYNIAHAFQTMMQYQQELARLCTIIKLSTPTWLFGIEEL